MEFYSEISKWAFPLYLYYFLELQTFSDINLLMYIANILKLAQGANKWLIAIFLFNLLILFIMLFMAYNYIVWYNFYKS